ncbi:MAG: hypothetical protein J6O49_12995 [Bacteroidaceae bacterium]|nr:hypothetical protein [Bacteroidaceae bacterium]
MTVEQSRVKEPRNHVKKQGVKANVHQIRLQRDPPHKLEAGFDRFEPYRPFQDDGKGHGQQRHDEP